MKKFFIFILIIALATFGVFCFLNSQQSKTIKILEEKISFLKDVYIPIKFLVTERQDSLIRFSIKFLDSDGNEIKKTSMEIVGDELNFDFRVIKIKDRFLAFPSKIFSDAIAPEKGIELYKLYDFDGFPAIYNSSSIENDFKTALSDVFRKLKNNTDKIIENEFGSVVHDLKGISKFEKDVIYQIVVHTKGGLEIIKG